MVASNRRYRKRNHFKPSALLPRQEEVRAQPHKPEAYQTNFTEVLKGDDITIGTYPDGYPIMPACLRREPLLKLVVNNLPADTSKDEAA